MNRTEQNLKTIQKSSSELSSSSDRPKLFLANEHNLQITNFRNIPLNSSHLIRLRVDSGNNGGNDVQLVCNDVIKTPASCNVKGSFL